MGILLKNDSGRDHSELILETISNIAKETTIELGEKNPDKFFKPATVEEMNKRITHINSIGQTILKTKLENKLEESK